MKFIYLAAGGDSFYLNTKEELPKCLASFNDKDRIIDKILENLDNVGVQDRIVVGGFKIVSIMDYKPNLKYFYNNDWKQTKSLFSLQKAHSEFDSDLIISYSDVIFKEQILREIISSDAQISIGYDSNWEKRYLGRNSDALKDSEKVVLTSNNQIRLKKDICDNENIIGEFIGLFKINRNLTNKLNSTINSILTKDKSASVCDLLNNLLENHSHSLFDVKGDWAELDSPGDLDHFKFGTKADTLKKLENKLFQSKILNQFKFTVEDYENDPDRVISKIQSFVNNEKLVVRSSALNEDTHNSSMAGNYESILNVLRQSKSSIANAIDVVIKSYLKGGQAKELNNQILVQPQLDNVQMSGVVFTKDLETSAPYYTINYDVSNKTDVITSGVGGKDQHTYIYFKNSSSVPEIHHLGTLIRSIKEIEKFTNHSSIDIEFAISNNEIYILQARPIAAHKYAVKVFESDIEKALNNIKLFLKSNLFVKIPKIVGNSTAYGIMPDWNPAEIIGIKPFPLAFDLYKYIITDSVWSQSRSDLGYRDIGYHPGIYSFSGQPYVDIRMSFNTFTPAELDDSIAEKLTNHYIRKLKLFPELHDKVEFDVAITSYDFDFENRLLELKEAGLSDIELTKVKHAFQNLTLDIVCEKITNIDEQIRKTSLLKENREAIINSEISISDKIIKLLEDCKNYGTHPFSILARLGFISSIMMKSLLKKGVITFEEHNNFFKTIQTVASDFVRDLEKVRFNRGLSKQDFIEKYGHLRPGTYDLNSKSYKENFDSYINVSSDFKAENKLDETDFEFSHETLKAIERELSLNGFDIKVKTFLDFVKKSTEARELAKFQFTKNLSQVLDYIIDFGCKLGSNRYEMMFLNLKDIIDASNGSISPNIINEIFNKIEYNKKKHLITSAIKLPPLIFSEKDIDGFFYESSMPNFTSQLTVEGELVILSDEQKNIENKIVMIENADPGFDWIFSHKIIGLITKYGGAASHMTIRCSEFGLPSAIGCGEKIYSTLKDNDIVQLDCLNQKINII